MKRADIFIAAVLAGVTHTAMAELKPLDDDAMSEIVGQGILAIDQIIGDGANNGTAGLEFTRLTISDDAELNANIGQLRLGNYACANCIHSTPGAVGAGFAPIDPSGVPGADIAVNNLSFGRVVNGQVESLQFADPYIELAYQNPNDPANRELVGIRFGFRNANGVIGADIQTLSGAVGVQLGILDGFNAGDVGQSIGQRQIALDTAQGAIGLNQIQGLQLNNAQNFFLGLQRVALEYPTLSPEAQQAVAQPGFWVNLLNGASLDLGNGQVGTTRPNNNF